MTAKHTHMTSSPAFTFLVRSIPDLDHIAPIAYALSQRGARVSVFGASYFLDIDNDFRLGFLRKECGVQVRLLLNLPDGKPARRLAALGFLFLARYAPFRRIRIMLRATQYWFLNESWANSVLDEAGTQVLSFDYLPIDAHPVTRTLARAAQGRGIPVVVVPHGSDVLYHETRSVIHAQKAEHKIVSRKDLTYAYADPDFPSEEIKVLGCARYNREWMNICDKVVQKDFPTEGLPGEPGKLKVLGCSRPRIGFYGDDPVFEKIKNLPNVDLIVAGKPRAAEGMRGIKQEWTGYPTTRLIQWADVVVFAGSSIAMDALTKGKKLLFLKYLCENDLFTFDTYNACCQINSEGELFDTLHKLNGNRNLSLYLQENVDRLIEDTVYAGDLSRDVLGGFADFFLSIADQRNKRMNHPE